MLERWVRTEDAYEREDPKRVYYLSMEFLIGRSLANNVANMLLDPVARQAARDEHLRDVVDEAMHVDRDRASVDSHFAGGFEIALGIDGGPDVRDRAADAAERRAQSLRRDRAVDAWPERVEQLVGAELRHGAGSSVVSHLLGRPAAACTPRAAVSPVPDRRRILPRA